MLLNTVRENRRLRAENKGLEAEKKQLRADLRAARSHRELAENDRDVWMRRAMGTADRVVDSERQARDLRRENTDLRERLARQDQIIRALQDANEAQYRHMAAKAGVSPAPQAAAAA